MPSLTTCRRARDQRVGEPATATPARERYWSAERPLFQRDEWLHCRRTRERGGQEDDQEKVTGAVRSEPDEMDAIIATLRHVEPVSDESGPSR